MNLSAIKRDLAKIRARLEPAVGAGAIHIPAHGGMAAPRMAFQAVQGGSPVAAPGRAVGACQGSVFKALQTSMRIERAKREMLELPPPSMSTLAPTPQPTEPTCPIAAETFKQSA
jgi:hypothetical protein